MLRFIANSSRVQRTHQLNGNYSCWSYRWERWHCRPFYISSWGQHHQILIILEVAHWQNWGYSLSLRKLKYLPLYSELSNQPTTVLWLEETDCCYWVKWRGLGSNWCTEKKSILEWTSLTPNQFALDHRISSHLVTGLIFFQTTTCENLHLHSKTAHQDPVQS